jgi:hypothetical protein
MKVKTNVKVGSTDGLSGGGSSVNHKQKPVPVRIIRVRIKGVRQLVESLRNEWL